MNDFIRKFLKIEFIRFAIVGIVATAIHYAVYYVLFRAINVNLAYTIGYLISLLCNFILSARFTFKSKANIKKGIGFVGSHLVNYLLHILFLNAFILLGVSKEFAPLPVFCCVIPINFILVRTVFKAKWFQQ